ncbi:hypothetical protein N0V88_002249 [Collariella sp. IMI 366227]|nr:hypothetical protein N0V88_002249 [Collariella sp. IMI 366227]
MSQKTPVTNAPSGEEHEMYPPGNSRNLTGGARPGIHRGVRYWFRLAGEKLSNMVNRVDVTVNQSRFGRFFQLMGSRHPKEIVDARFVVELRAGLTTFTTMAYIIAVNSDDYQAFILAENVKLDLITATAAVAGFSSILFGLFTNLPVVLGPGMGLNAYFTYQVVGVKGSGSINYKLALTAVFLEGWIFMFLALTGMRHWLVKIIPNTIKIASGVGIGLFLTLIGMSYTSGIGLITGGINTPLNIGGCPVEDLNEIGECARNYMTNPKMWIGVIFGGMLTTILMAYRVRGSIIIGIALVSFLSWPRNTPFTYFPNTAEGDRRFEFFSKVVSFHPIHHTLAQQQWDLKGEGAKFAIALFTFLYVDIIDCTATLYSMARFCSRARRDRRDFPRSTLAFCVDALCISMGALLGCSPVTAFIESSAGIAEGGRTGLTAIAAGVGCMMIRQVTKINWVYIGDAIPSFITLAFIPFSYSVAYGLIAGLFTYTAINGTIWICIKISRERYAPENYDLKEYWTWKPPGAKPWILRKGVELFNRMRNKKQQEGTASLNTSDEYASNYHVRDEVVMPHTTPKRTEDGVDVIRVATPEPFRRVF